MKYKSMIALSLLFCMIICVGCEKDKVVTNVDPDTSLVSLTSISEKDTDANDIKENVLTSATKDMSGVDIRDMSFVYEDVTCSLLFPVTNLLSKNWYFDKNGELEPNTQVDSVSLLNDDYPDVGMFVELVNKGDQITAYEKCDVKSFDIDVSYAKDDDYPKIILPKNIAWGATVEEVKAAYGKPDDEYEGDLYYNLAYNLSDYSGEVNLYFYKDDFGLRQVQFAKFDM